MFANRALSIAFWSAARLPLICFFCSRLSASRCSDGRARIGGESVSYLRLLSLLEKGLLAGLLLGLLASEVLWLRDIAELLVVDALEVDLLRRRDDVPGVDSPERNAVDLEGAGDEENALVEVLEEDDALAAEAAREQDQDGTGLQRRSRGPGPGGLADLRKTS